jgi:hypothetical protein
MCHILTIIAPHQTFISDLKVELLRLLPSKLSGLELVGSPCQRQSDILPSLGVRRLLTLNPLGQMNRNFVISIYGRSSITIANFVPIRNQTWPPQAIVVSDGSISKKKSSPLKPLGPGGSMS